MSTRVVRLVVVVASIAIFVAVGSALAVESPEGGVGEDRLVAEGRVVYENNCQGCHQADGGGLPGVFPALVGSPVIDDTASLVDIITNGQGSMPGFSSLSDDEIESLAAYVQKGLGVPPPAAPEPPAPTAPDPGLPLAAVLAITAGFGIFVVVVIAVGGPIALAKRHRHTFTTLQVWLKVAFIVLYFVIATVFVPSWVVQSGFLASPPSAYEDVFSSEFWGVVRDLVGTGVWLAALLAGLWALRRAQRKGLI